MNKRQETWGWMLAVDFFFAGMGGAMVLIAAAVDIFLGKGYLTMPAYLAGPIFIAIGAAFLSIELGRPFQAWRVFMNTEAIMTKGAWCMVIAMILGFIHAAFSIWGVSIAANNIIAVIAAIFGLIVAAYPGVLLGRHGARPFWSGTGLIAVFFISSLVTAIAANILIIELLVTDTMALAIFTPLAAIILLIQLVFWIGYIAVKYEGPTVYEKAATYRWLQGDYTAPFFLGVILVGSILPIIFAILGLELLASVSILLGGIIMRFLVVYSGEDRTFLPGEQNYFAKLPKGDEEFLKKAWTPKQ